MIDLVASLVAFIGGVLGRAIGLGGARHRLLAFIAPVLVCTALSYVPWMIDLCHSGPLPPDWETILSVGIEQCLTLLWAAFLTGIGWFCSYCIQNTFEDTGNETDIPPA